VPIGISDEHVEFANAIRKWAETAGAITAVRSAEESSEVLREWPGRAAEMGISAIALPEEVGGGGSLLDQAVATEAAAQSLVPGETLTSTIAGILVSDPELQAGAAAGEVVFGVGLTPSLKLVDGHLSGSVSAVAGAPLATHLLLGSDQGWFVVPVAEAEVTPGVSMDLSRTIGAVELNRVPIERVVEQEFNSDQLHQLVWTLGAAEASGVARWCLDIAVEYAGVREQFGKKIGAFQAIKHMCAEMLELSESATTVAWDAASAWNEDAEQRRFAALNAGVVAFDAAVSVAKSCIQILGGIGFTFEHDAHLYLRRAIFLRSWVGGTSNISRSLAQLAAGDVRRHSTIDFEGSDREIREQASSIAGRIASLPVEEQRAALVETGYITPHWPKPYGVGATPMEQIVIDEELTRAGVGRVDLKIGGWAAPTILAHGTPEQIAKFVGPTLSGDIIWCQLFSEPGAGSDLASLRTKAVRDGAGWRLTGQKVWTSLAKEADWAICLARTSSEGKPHAGITYFLLDMKSEGLDIRPLREMTGEALFNEVFLDNVFIPDEYVVGEVNGGWKLTRTTLANERIAMGGHRLGDSVERAVKLLDDDPVKEYEVGQAVAWATTTKLLSNRALMRSLAGAAMGAESSVGKLVGVRSRQDSAELVVNLLGDRVFSGDDLSRAAVHEQLLTRCLSIAGGTTQVLRNVAGERILGLPRG
jgi:alkylation response protein AidB-like acyl-CoA dehydrogenase